MAAKLTTSRYRRFIAQLNQLNEYRRLAEVAGHVELAERIQRVLGMFERENKDAILARGKRKPVKFDEYGRTYTIGRRKESTARCWVIAARPAEEESASPPTPTEAAVESATEATTEAATVTATEAAASETPDAPEIPPSAAIGAGVEGFVSPAAPVKVSTTNILVNNIPFAEYL